MGITEIALDESLHDQRLTWTAKGIIASLLLLPRAEVSAEQLAAERPDGEGETVEDIREALQLLRETGWIPTE